MYQYPLGDIGSTYPVGASVVSNIMVPCCHAAMVLHVSHKVSLNDVGSYFGLHMSLPQVNTRSGAGEPIIFNTAGHSEHSPGASGESSRDVCACGASNFQLRR